MLTQNRRTDSEFSNTLTQNSLEQVQCYADREPKNILSVFKHVDPKLFRTARFSVVLTQNRKTDSVFSNTSTQNFLEQVQCHVDLEPKNRLSVFKHVDPKLFRTARLSVLLTQNRRTDSVFSNTLTQNSLKQAQCHADPEPKNCLSVYKHVDPNLFRTARLSVMLIQNRRTNSVFLNTLTQNSLEQAQCHADPEPKNRLCVFNEEPLRYESGANVVFLRLTARLTVQCYHIHIWCR